jgi:MFS family permease
MTNFLLDKNNNTAIIIAGILSLVVGMGLARFAFTSFLPFMLSDFLSVERTGILASLNYVGYISGTLFAIFITNINTKVRIFRLGLILCVISCFLLGVFTNEYVWILLRITAGVGTAAVMIVGSAIVMKKLNLQYKKTAMGIYFSGIGAAIVTMDLCGRLMIEYTDNWQLSWQLLAIVCALLAVYPFYILSFTADVKNTAVIYKFERAIFTPFVIILTIAYFSEGVGFVTQATFLPDIINQVEGLAGLGSKVWLLAGLAAIPSVIILMKLAHKFGSIKIMQITMFLQAVGVIIPALTSNMWLCLLSGVLYGSTFAGLVALFMNIAGEINKDNPVVLMAAFTSAYGIGQITSPLASVALIEYSNDYNYALYLTAFIVILGVILLGLTKFIDHKNFCRL